MDEHGIGSLESELSNRSPHMKITLGRRLSLGLFLLVLGFVSTPAGANVLGSMLACMPPSDSMQVSDRTDGVSELPGYG